MPTVTTDKRRHEAPGQPELHMTRSEDPTAYLVKRELDATQKDNRAAEDDTIARALDILRYRLTEPGACIDTPSATRQFLALELAQELSEVFCCMFLDNRHRVIRFDRLFTGTIDGCSVHPREVVRACIKYNAAALILAHNHPSGEAEPSRADITLTKRLVEAVALIDVRILDHIVIGGASDYTSFAERGLI